MWRRCASSLFVVFIWAILAAATSECLAATEASYKANEIYFLGLSLDGSEVFAQVENGLLTLDAKMEGKRHFFKSAPSPGIFRVIDHA